jgi:branched-chain amino acid transport system ATP-binding protein
MSAVEALLSCERLSKSYGGLVAVRGVSLLVGAGEIVGLVGPNGAGKTTVVDLVVGTQRSDSGQITVGGKKVHGPPSRRARAGLARTFQHPQLALELSIRENLALGAGARQMETITRLALSLARGLVSPSWPGIADGEIESIASALGIEDLDRECSELSLGEQRLVEVGRALLRRPAVILLDEPFAGADPDGIERICAALRQVAADGFGVLVVDHNVDIIAALVNRLVLMNQGSVVFNGSAAEGMSSPQMREVYFGTASKEGKRP